MLTNVLTVLTNVLTVRRHANFIWGDDAFMGLTVPARLAQAKVGNPFSNARVAVTTTRLVTHEWR